MRRGSTLRSFLFHPLWPEIAPFLRFEFYRRDRGGRGPRHRIEVAPPDAVTAAGWLKVEMPCVHCGRLMHPIRVRKTRSGRPGSWRALYFAAACPLDEGYACSRGRKSADEYQLLLHAVRWADTFRRPPDQGALF